MRIDKACAEATDTYIPKNQNNKKSAVKPKQEAIIFEQDGRYYLQRGKNIKQLTNFVMRGVEMVNAIDETQMICDFITDEGETFRLTLLSEDFCDLGRFKKVLTKTTIALSYFGTSGDLEVLKQFAHRLEWTRKQGVKIMGIHDHENHMTFVSTSGAVRGRNKRVDSIVQLDNHRNINSDILSKPFLKTSEQLRFLGEIMLSYNEYAKTVSILAWTAGCFIKYHLKKSEAKYPHMFFTGITGSGKSTTLERFVMPIFSCLSILAASQAKPFGLMKQSCSSNIVPQFINEFKPSTLDPRVLNALINHFRDSYDKHEGIRGDVTLKLNTYELLAPILVAGEQTPGESAIRERTIELLFSRNDIENADNTPNMKYKDAFDMICESKSLLESFGRTLLDVALRTTPKEVNAWYAEGQERYKGDFPSRVTSNLACCYAGLKLVEKVCELFKQPWTYIFPISLDECADELGKAVKEFLLDGGNHSKTVIEETFEIMARMGLKHEKDYLLRCFGTMRVFCIGLGLVGAEYKLCRQLLSNHLSGNSSWRYSDGESKPRSERVDKEVVSVRFTHDMLGKIAALASQSNMSRNMLIESVIADYVNAETAAE